MLWQWMVVATTTTVWAVPLRVPPAVLRRSGPIASDLQHSATTDNYSEGREGEERVSGDEIVDAEVDATIY